MSEFSNKVIIITGPSSGIGRALALHLAPQRPWLVLAARDVERLQEVADSCERQGARTLVVPTDIADPDACEALIQRTVAACEKIDVLVNNAGFSMWATVEEVQDVDLFKRLMQVNYLGSVWCTKFALPYLKGTGGRIVAISSLAGLTGVPGHSGYCATKHAMQGFFDSLRIELDGTGVTVTIIAPDFVQSEIHARSVKGDGSPSGRVLRAPGSVLTADACAKVILQAMTSRKRLAFTSVRGRWGRWIKLLSPALVDWMAKKGVADTY